MLKTKTTEAALPPPPEGRGLRAEYLMKDFILPYLPDISAEAAFLVLAAFGVLLVLALLFHFILAADWLKTRLDVIFSEDAFSSGMRLARNDSESEFLAQLPVWI